MSTARQLPICLVPAIAVALTCAGPSLAHGAGVRAWLTTGDQSSLLAEQPEAALGAPDPALATIAVDPTRSFQRMRASAPRSPTPRPTGAAATFVLPHAS
jgi:hypothetical protein